VAEFILLLSTKVQILSHVLAITGACPGLYPHIHINLYQASEENRCWAYDLCSNFLKTSHKSSFNFNNLLKRQILKTAVILEQCHLLADWKNCKPSAWLIFLVMAMTRSISDVPISMQLTLIN